MTTSHSDIPRRLGDYALTEEVGRGPQCTVWQAVGPGGGVFALKILDPSYAEDERRVSRFEQEARLALQLDHPHIVRVHQFVTHLECPLPFYAMDFMAGGNIGQFRGAPSQEFPIIVRIVQQVCIALDYLHGRGLVHCDIKPTNILLDAERRAFLADFGTTASAEHLAETGARGGTIGYMAPEQFASVSAEDTSGTAIDARADIYSLGMVMYDIFAGELPFRGSNRFAVLYQRLHSEPRKPRELRGDIPPQLEAVILKAIAREPGHRYQAAAEFAAALRSV